MEKNTSRVWATQRGAYKFEWVDCGFCTNGLDPVQDSAGLTLVCRRCNGAQKWFSPVPATDEDVKAAKEAGTLELSPTLLDGGVTFSYSIQPASSPEPDREVYRNVAKNLL